MNWKDLTVENTQTGGNGHRAEEENEEPFEALYVPTAKTTSARRKGVFISLGLTKPTRDKRLWAWKAAQLQKVPSDLLGAEGKRTKEKEGSFRRPTAGKPTGKKRGWHEQRRGRDLSRANARNTRGHLKRFANRGRKWRLLTFLSDRSKGRGRDSTG